MGAGSNVPLSFLNPLAAAQTVGLGPDRNIGNVSNEINKFGRDITGETAREAASKAATAQEQAQADTEKKIKDKEAAMAAAESRRKQINAVRAGRSGVAGAGSGRNSTILTSGLGSIGSIQSGTKTLLGS